MKNFIFRYLISLILVIVAFGTYIYFGKEEVSYYGKLGSFKYTIIFLWPYANFAISIAFYIILGTIAKRKIFIFLGLIVLALVAISLILNYHFITKGFFIYLVAYTWIAVVLAIPQLLIPNFTIKPHQLDNNIKSSYLIGILSIFYIILFVFIIYY